ncbi:hypothetical protein DYB32_004602 [Aphanomyces invadans]|uniref:Uncharacterized protein n=1 Tax=Aphanomyces invadans TaxID=157072 RepID=A0A418AX10_9STRA|nr:hypothetical protein DYB32_004602 [Aphanomyces invadans]
MNSYHVKYKCLQDGTLKPREAAKKYNVNNRTISRWKADADSIRQRVESAPPGAKLTRKPRTDFKRKERPLSKDERRFKTFIESRSKTSKLRMADVIAKCQQLLPTSAGKQGHNLYMYVFRWLRRHQLMDCVAFNTTGRPKAHTSDEDNDDDDLEADDRDEAADAAYYDAQTARPSNDAPSSSDEEGVANGGEKSTARSDEMSVIYALTALAEGSGNGDSMSKKGKKNAAAKEPKPAPSTTQSDAAQGVATDKSGDSKTEQGEQSQAQS